MLTPRIIPCLLVHKKGLVKTVRFRDPKYVGDPINAVRIFNEKQADELIVLDIDATREGRGPDFSMVERIAAECRMPLCYGGGVTTVEQAERLIRLGVEKVAFGAAAVNNPELLALVASRLGSQSVVAVVDVLDDGATGGKVVATNNATVLHSIPPATLVSRLAKSAVGEVVINSVSRDGTCGGYDIALACQLRREAEVPLTMLGGAGSLDHIHALYRAAGIVGAAAGSLFVFKGRLKAVLINYPSSIERASIDSRTPLPPP